MLDFASGLCQPLQGQQQQLIAKATGQQEIGHHKQLTSSDFLEVPVVSNATRCKGRR
jgi:hypothetical protein